MLDEGQVMTDHEAFDYETICDLRTQLESAVAGQVEWRKAAERYLANLCVLEDRIVELCRIIQRAGQPYIDEANRVVPEP